MPEPTPTPAPTPIRFEQALAELEKILRELEDGTTTLDEALSRYERGIGLLKQCYGQLQQAEIRIKQLTGLCENGQPTFAPFEHTSSVEKKAPPKRPRPPAEPTDDAY